MGCPPSLKLDTIVVLYPKILSLLLGKRCGYKINKLANHIEKVAYDTGIARTTGGGLGIASGIIAIGGILAAPFTAGTSLALTVGGVATGVASATTTLTATVVKERHLKADVEAIKTLIDDLKGMDDIVNAEFAKLKVVRHQQQ